MNAPVRIVVIEDEKAIRRFLRMTLEAEGIVVAEAETGREGLAEIGMRRPDLVILDLGLPDMDGVELIRQLRAWTPLPVLVLSARSDEAQKVDALDAGADDYLTKPFGSSELMARIRAQLRRRGADDGEADAVFRFGTIVVDFPARTVTRDGAPVHLTPIEYKLLAVLVRNAGKVLTHTQLLREAWGAGSAERSHYLRIYMGHLRQKLETDPARPVHILTETGVGYRLVA
ncbi:response regulator [Noviherbaspirillum denitrificans]|uniref:Two-component system response regulator n=1 Tax=Noviherbaspirillum denitrificans TaxID=1968433 RepID=A0A254TAC2_9BURK|nr:response regulator [Noviherbaspirillum denitrificans]OWW19584.1 two-component system response regulator [Noviherbaspirillum denitrificans]